MTLLLDNEKRKKFAIKEKIYNSLYSHVLIKMEPEIRKKIESSVLRTILWDVADWICNREYKESEFLRELKSL